MKSNKKQCNNKKHKIYKVSLNVGYILGGG